MKLFYPIRITRSQKGATETAAYLHELYFKHRNKYLKRVYGRSMFLPYRTWRWCWGELAVKPFKLIKKNGRAVYEITGIPAWKQYFDMLKFSLILPTRPQNYYIYDLFDPQNRAAARDFIFRHETKNVLYKMLDVPRLGEISPLTDKGKFARKALAAGLPIAPTICSIEDGKVEYFNELPPEDLFVKRLKGKGGAGAELWFYLSREGVYRKKGRKLKLDADRLIRHYREKSGEEPVLIQARVTNHPELIDISCSALSTCRVMTILNEKDEPEVVAAVYRMAARQGSIVDNFHRGGIAAPVNIDSGTLGLATNLGLKADLGRVACHPLTGAQIEGRKLPFWAETMQLAVRAHEAFRPRVVVGWDICITESGPILIEGNAQPCVDFIQRTYNQPLGRMRFGEIMAFHLRRRFG